MFSRVAKIILQSLQLYPESQLGRVQGVGAIVSESSVVRVVVLSVFFLRNSFYHVTELRSPNVYEIQAEGCHANGVLVGVFFQECVFM